jgi:hypothetical protein
VESRFGPHFPAVEGREVDKGIAAFALDALTVQFVCFR